MAIERFTNPALIPLQITYITFEGEPKLDVVSASVRVFQVTSGGAEIDILLPTPLARIGGSSTWRYNWVSPPLPTPGTYIAEYTASDTDLAESIDIEDITIFDQSEEDQLVLAKLTAIENRLASVEASMDTVLDSDLGRWYMNSSDNTLTLYRRDGSVLKVFDLKNELGIPSVTRVFDKVPRP